MIDPKEVNEVMEEELSEEDKIEALTGSDPTEEEVESNGNGLPEAPASLNIKFWIEGYGVMLTMRSLKVKEVINRLEYVIDYAKRHGWQKDWKEEEEKTLTPPKSFAEKDTQENCPHTQFKIAQVKREGPNTGKYFKTCVSCSKFLGWVAV